MLAETLLPILLLIAEKKIESQPDPIPVCYVDENGESTCYPIDPNPCKWNCEP